AAPGQVIGIHDISGGTGASWLEVTFHQQSWGGNGGAVFDLATNTWSLVTNRNPYWSGHVSMGNGKYANASGSVDGRDSRGMVVRNPDNLMDSSQYQFVGQPTGASNNWCDAEHNSWLNSVRNPDAPILASRYGSCQFAWAGEIIAIAVDGSDTVWRFAHNHNGGNVCYYADAFAQISNDGKWALFSSYWDGTLGPDTAFGCSTRIDTFIVELSPTAPAGDFTIFGAAAPTNFFTGSSPVELGVKFRSDVNGTITRIRFYKGAGDNSVHTGSLWSSTGTLLATGTFSAETSAGWQQLNFSTPVPIVANTTYVASYHTGGSFYYSYNYLLSSGVDNAPLHALKNGIDGPNGVYIYGSGGVFPDQTYLASNYW